MAIDNTITVGGNITRDPELRYTTSGRGVASFGMAVNRRYQKDNEWVEEVTFVNIVAWGDMGEHAAASLSKGDRIIVSGRLEVRAYDDKEGVKRTVTEIVADDLGPSLKWAEATVQRIARDDSRPPKERPPLPEEEPF